jgi:hypothetical protein
MLPQQAQDGPIVVQGGAQIALRKARQKVHILAPQGSVQPQLSAQFLNVGGACSIPQHQNHRISGNQVDEGEDQGRHQQCDGHCLSQTPKQVRAHPSTTPNWRTR